MKTTLPVNPEAQRKWVLLDAENQVLGRLASRIAMILRGRHKPIFTPFMDTGDFVVVINVEKVTISGRKKDQEVHQRYSGYPSGLKMRKVSDVLIRHPDHVLRRAVKGMMPDGPLARRMLGKLKIYAGPNHPHTAQQPEPYNDKLWGKPHAAR